MQDEFIADSLTDSTANNICSHSSIGTSFNPFSEEFLANPYVFYAQAVPGLATGTEHQ